MENPTGEDPPVEDAARCDRYTSSEEEQARPAPTTEERVAGKRPAASDINPDHAADQRVAEPACAAEDTTPQTTDQPAATAAATGAEGESAPASVAASTPLRDGEAARTAPPSSVAEGEDRAPTPPPAEERGVPTPPRAGASSSAGSPGLVQGPVMPATTTGGGAANEETQAAFDDEVEEIEASRRDEDGARVPACRGLRLRLLLIAGLIQVGFRVTPPPPAAAACSDPENLSYKTGRVLAS
ncbi:uncharacterized protein LOC110436481 [Sorghum bicolor]|uniref:uncharacterized protein LOC110436481 n=1 Tax=Sorghum bicolor TaxID=4558 RepID=UPI000B42675E|nr:uncharacterized protein LOC110436481 [Sorghum bicolor]|eukprot:XP_021319261.1 uncharacterized protein LOC110436481 [Sorghum bicolor]